MRGGDDDVRRHRGWVGRVGDDPFGRFALVELAEMVEVINDLAGRADWVLPGLSEGAQLTGRTDAAGVAAYYLYRGLRRVGIKDGAAGCSRSAPPA